LLCEQAGSPAPGVDEQGTVDPGGLIRMVPLILRRRSPYWCGAGLSALTVTPKGDVYPCHLFLSHSEYQVGNVLSGTWDDRVVDRLRSNKKPNDPVCRACDVDWACTGCIGGALNARGNVNPRYPQFCAAVRENATRTLQQCAELVTGGESSRRRIRDTLEECFAPR
jgi:radical SAM protein with 4Fe4S-binding SPASM domain